MEHVAILFVHDIILAAARPDVDLPLGDHVGELVGIGAGGVHHGPGLEGTHRGDHLPVTVGELAKLGHLGVAQELGAVHGGVLREGHGQLIGANDAAGSHQQGLAGGAAHVGLPTAELLLVDDPELAPAAVLDALIEELLQSGMIVLVEGDHQGGVPLHRHFQFFMDLVEHGVAQDVILCLQGVWLAIVSAVDDGGVGLALPVADIVGLFQQQRLRLIPGQLPGDGTTHHAAADDDHIIHRIHLSFVLTRKRSRLTGAEALHKTAPFDSLQYYAILTGQRGP